MGDTVAMSSGQFQLWVALAQVGVGAAVVFSAFFLGMRRVSRPAASDKG
jgi:hypothetical protein